GATVSFTVTAIDLVDGAVAVSCSPASGAIFALGTTTVQCTAADAHHNPTNGTFTVKVRDTTPPTLNGVPASQTVEATGSSGATVTYAPPTATDLVDGTD